jgi:hypothetical protein
MNMRLHISLLSAMLTLLEFLLAWIPIKILAAQYAGRSSLADSVLTVL